MCYAHSHKPSHHIGKICARVTNPPLNEPLFYCVHFEVTGFIAIVTASQRTDSGRHSFERERYRWSQLKLDTILMSGIQKQTNMYINRIPFVALSGERRRTGRDVITSNEHRATKHTTKHNLILRCNQTLKRNLMSGIQKQTKMYMNRIPIFQNTFWWTQKNRARRHQYKWAQSY